MPQETMSNTELLRHKALTVKLYRKKPSRNMLDRQLSAELSKIKGVADNASLRVNKSLFTKESTTPYMKILSEAGQYFYRTTTPWDDQGFRLLSSDIYKDFTKQFKKYTRTFREAAEGFIDGIERDMETMRETLGEAFDRSNYDHLFLSNGKIDRDSILERFTLELEFGTVPDGNDIRASLTEDDRNIIAQHITEKNESKFAASQKHIITMLHEHVMAIHERLCKDKNIFRDTLISNLKDLCDLIPKMNIAADPALNRLAEDAKRKLCHWEPETLREDTTIRSDVAKDAEKILDNMKGLI